MKNTTKTIWFELNIYIAIDEENVLDNFSGQPFLCDFGVGVTASEYGPGGVGPDGTSVIAPRLMAIQPKKGQ